MACLERNFSDRHSRPWRQVPSALGPGDGRNATCPGLSRQGAEPPSARGGQSRRPHAGCPSCPQAFCFPRCPPEPSSRLRFILQTLLQSCLPPSFSGVPAFSLKCRRLARVAGATGGRRPPCPRRPQARRPRAPRPFRVGKADAAVRSRRELRDAPRSAGVGSGSVLGT